MFNANGIKDIGESREYENQFEHYAMPTIGRDGGQVIVNIHKP